MTILRFLDNGLWERLQLGVEVSLFFRYRSDLDINDPSLERPPTKLVVEVDLDQMAAGDRHLWPEVHEHRDWLDLLESPRKLKSGIVYRDAPVSWFDGSQLGDLDDLDERLAPHSPLRSLRMAS